MKGTLQEVVSMMHSMLTDDLIQKIEDKTNELITAPIFQEIGSTYLDRISYVIHQRTININEQSYFTSIWNELVPSDFDKLAIDISIVYPHLSIVYIGAGEDEGVILFKHWDNYFIIIYHTLPPARLFPYSWDEMILNIKTGTDIDVLFEDV
jgi:hypothetical protein